MGNRNRDKLIIVISGSTIHFIAVNDYYNKGNINVI